MAIGTSPSWASFCLRRALILIHRYPAREEEIQFQLAKYRHALNAFSALKQKQRSLYNPDCFEERVERKLLAVVESFAVIQENSDAIDEILQELEQEHE